MRFLASDQLPTDLSAKKMAANKARKDCPRVLYLIWVDLYLILCRNLKLLKISVNCTDAKDSISSIEPSYYSCYLCYFRKIRRQPCSNCRSCRAVTCCDGAPRCFQMVRRKCNLRRGRLVHVQRKKWSAKIVKKTIKRKHKLFYGFDRFLI